MKTFICVLLIIGATLAAKPTVKSSRIIGGKTAADGQFPYQISYQWGLLGTYQHMCGGSILSPNWILIAGHCVTEAPGFGSFKIIAGVNQLDDVEGQERVVVEKVVHPDYAGGVAPNDIALLHLDKPLDLNEKVATITLPESGLEASGDSTLSGWGVTNNIIPLPPNDLQYADIPIISNQECNDALEAILDGEENPFDTNSNMCTGPLSGGVSACSGDSGGPLVLANTTTIVGVVSWGMTPCASEGAPAVYTKVSNFIDFIKEHVDDLP